MILSYKNFSLLKLHNALCVLLAPLFILPAPALAEINSQSESGFSVFHIADVAAEPDEIWGKLLLPNSWWSGDHSFSGDADNFYLEPKVDGCFCELLKTEEDGKISDAGAVEHMRIIHIDRARSLRMLGALGPLQSEAVSGTFTVAIKPNGDGTSKLSFLYVVGGYMRFETLKIAPSIDRVIGEQFGNLVKLIGPVLKTDDIDSTDTDTSEALVIDKDIIELSTDDEEDGDTVTGGQETDEEDKKSDTDEVRRER